MATSPSTELDFDTIKQQIIDYIKTDPTFTDYNFEGSALSSIINILAYNTHTNAFLASMGHSERFIDTAQKRSSVVSKAKELGYTPISAVCSTAFVDITLNGTTSASLLPRGTSFSSSNENGSYEFIVAEDVSSKDVGGVQKFVDVKLLNGVRLSNSFVMNATQNIRSVFTIPNGDIDTSTLKVYVRDTPSSIGRSEYILAENVYGVKANSKVYFLQESYDGFYQIYFGGDVIGAKPQEGAVIEIDYFVTEKFSQANGCTLFGFDGSIGSASSITINTTQVAFGGSTAEDINSIKINAVKSNSAKERAVTPSDYELSIKEQFNFVKSVSVWGGEDNTPPVYGKVFISMQPVAGFTISDSVKKNVMYPKIRKNSLLTIIPEFVDPDYTLMEFETKIKFNPSNSISTRTFVETGVRSAIVSYITSVSNFNTDYINSTLSTNIREVDPGISAVSISKRVGFKFAPLINVSTNYSRSFNNSIVSGTIGSTKFFTFDGTSPRLVTMKEIPAKVETVVNTQGAIENINAIGLYTESGEFIKEIGTVNLSTGKVDIAVSVSSYLTSNRFIQMTCKFVEDDIVTKRNQILALDTINEDSVIGLLNNNRVITEIYDK